MILNKVVNQNLPMSREGDSINRCMYIMQNLTRILIFKMAKYSWKEVGSKDRRVHFLLLGNDRVDSTTSSVELNITPMKSLLET